MNSMRLIVTALILLSGCAGMDGRGLVPGQSTEKDVQALMGTPAERLKAADGDSIWFYPHQPFGRQMYAVRLTPAGAVRSVAQVLTEPNVAKLVPGVSTRSQARELFGPPFEQSRFPRQQREVWTYTAYNGSLQEFFLHVQFSDDGIVREVIFIQDYSKEMGDTKP
jgi:outer membrane protein assembly factor BamE (lipoprotein component of BamABCDE complex)